MSGERPRSNSVSCTPTQWSRIRLRSRHAGLPLSRFIVERCLSGVLPPEAARDGRGAPIGLCEAGERARYNKLREVVEWMSLESAPGTPWVVDQRGYLRSWCREWMEGMVLHGRRERLEEILREALGPERAERVVAHITERLGGQPG